MEGDRESPGVTAEPALGGRISDQGKRSKDQVISVRGPGAWDKLQMPHRVGMRTGVQRRPDPMAGDRPLGACGSPLTQGSSFCRKGQEGLMAPLPHKEALPYRTSVKITRPMVHHPRM